MAEGICYVCRDFKVVEPDRATVERELVKHMMAEHRGYIEGDALNAHGKYKFDKCPVCGAVQEKVAMKCPNCGADLVEQFATMVAKDYTKD